MFKFVQGVISYGPLFVLGLISFLTLRSVAEPLAFTQLGFLFAAIVLIVIISRIDYHLYLFSPWPWYLICLGLLSLTLLIGDPIRGSIRWLNLFGLGFQTSEFVKPIFLIFITSYLTQASINSVTDLFKIMLLISMPLALIFLEPDLGTVLVYLFAIFALLLASGIPFRTFLALLICLTLLLPLGYQLLKPYQRDRLTTFLLPQTDPLGSGYNAAQAAIAVGSGQWLGRGLGQGTQSHLRFLPERHTDFIFASFVEEMGFIGGTIILGAYFALGIHLLSIAQNASSEAGSLISIGTLAFIFAQVFVNIGMNINLIPVTGITLPFISSGGSSILALSILVGLSFSVRRFGNYQKPSLEIH